MRAKKILNNAFFEKKLYDIIKNYDIIQTAEYDQLANIKLRKKLKDKLIIYHGPYASKYTKKYNIKCILSDFLIFFNKEYKNTVCLTKSNLATQFLKNKGFTNVKTIGVGLDTDRFIKNGANKESKPEYQGKNLLYIGKIEDRRNPLLLLEILNKIEDNIKLIVIGNGNRKYLKKFEENIKKYNLEKRIIYKSKMEQRELRKIYENNNVFLFPSKYEIFGMVLLEAMYFNNIVISSVNGGSTTLIKDKINGYIIDGFDVDKLVLKINEIISDKNNKDVMVKASNTIKQEYTWDKLVNKFIKGYKESIDDE